MLIVRKVPPPLASALLSGLAGQPEFLPGSRVPASRRVSPAIQFPANARSGFAPGSSIPSGFVPSSIPSGSSTLIRGLGERSSPLYPARCTKSSPGFHLPLKITHWEYPFLALNCVELVLSLEDHEDITGGDQGEVGQRPGHLGERFAERLDSSPD